MNEKPRLVPVTEQERDFLLSAEAGMLHLYDLDVPRIWVPQDQASPWFGIAEDMTQWRAGRKTLPSGTEQGR
jgi:hypothetical protein